ncbi:MAG: hypothetical protein HC775_09480 [Hyellaceae cyanobacterium CSU_1_1]|nr:hypothetical protein [Hyellaceae cyanobacterium CSU_1_1]
MCVHGSCGAGNDEAGTRSHLLFSGVKNAIANSLSRYDEMLNHRHIFKANF